MGHRTIHFSKYVRGAEGAVQDTLRSVAKITRDALDSQAGNQGESRLGKISSGREGEAFKALSN